MITGIVITLNESRNIAACILSLRQVCDEVIVVDSLSSDDTVDVARQAGAIIVLQAYLGDGPQKNVGIGIAGNNWILSLDADERLTDGMVEVIRNLQLATTAHDAFAFRRRNYVGSRWIRHCGWYPDYCVRLYNKHSAQFAETLQHSRVHARNPKRLTADILHYSYEEVGQLFAKPGRNFSGRAAKIMYLQGKRANGFSPLLHGANAWIRKYLLQAGFMAGVDGMSIAISAAVNSYLKYAKLLELQRDPNVLKRTDFGRVW
jgi:glycosyltransferase involved in cell wall biosynthesis